MIKVFEINTEFKEVTTKEPVIVLKIDKLTAYNLQMSLGMVISKVSKNWDNDNDTNLEMVKKFHLALSTEINSTKI